MNTMGLNHLTHQALVSEFHEYRRLTQQDGAGFMGLE